MKAIFSIKTGAFFAGAALLASAFYFTGCTKEEITATLESPAVENHLTGAAADRAPFQYGITVWAPGSPSKIVNINTGTTAVVPNVPDLKGIAQFNGGSGDFYVTSGPNNPVGFKNRMYRVNPATGAILAAYGPGGGYPSTVSDICMIDVTPLNMYGLKDNTNALARIGWPSFGTATYAAMTGIAAGYTARGLTWTRNPITSAFELMAFCTRPGGPAKYYRVAPATAVCTFVCDVFPIASYNGNNCGAGYFYFPSPTLIINTSGGAGLNSFAWTGACPVPVSAPWGPPVADYEDLASIVY